MMRLPTPSKRGLGAAALLAALLVAGCSLRPASFDLRRARLAADLDAAEIHGATRVENGVTVHEIRFNSLAWDGDAAQPIRIQAFVAIPLGKYPPHSKPGIVFAHGLGDQGNPQAAADLSRNLDVVALALSGPGLGGSEGRALTPTNPGSLFAGAKDIRKSWLYVYVYAILRSITYLQTRPEVDAEAIAVTGFSMGGIATFIANGVDDRIRAALPVAAAGGLLQAASAGSWLRQLVLSVPGQQLEDPGPVSLFRALDPLRYAGQQHGAVYMLIGAQDEYFPLEQAIQMYKALRAPAKNLTLVPDYDHGWYFGGGCPAPCMPGGPQPPSCPPAPVCPQTCPLGSRPPYCGPQASYNRLDDFNTRWSQLLRTLLARHVARWPRPLPPAPVPPRVERTADAVVVQPMTAAHAVRLAVSEDCGFTYSQILLGRGADGAFTYPRPVAKDAIVFAEAESSEGAISTSLPSWPLTCKLRVRDFGPRPPAAPESKP